MAVPYYLPLTRKTLSDFLNAGTIPALPVERAALFAALLRLEGKAGSAGLGMLLSQAMALFAADPDAGAATLRDARAALAGGDTADLVARLADHGLLLASAEQMAGDAWSDGDGRYSDHFQTACRAILSDYTVEFPADGASPDAGPDGDLAVRVRTALRGTRDQEVAARVIAAGAGEHIAIDAYAGTGKTFLVHALDQALNGGFTYIAPTRAHLHGFRRHAGAAADSGLRTLTVWELGHALARDHAKASGLAQAPRVVPSGYPPERQAEVAGIAAAGRLSPAAVLRLARKGLDAWCQTADPALEASHFRRVRLPDEVPAALLVAAGLRLWRAMFQPQPLPGHVFDVSLDHLAKWLVLADARIALRYGTLLVDEAHDLSHAWRRLFDTYPGGHVLMGDPHQRLRGRMPRSAQAKQLTMGTSLRTGVGAERLIEHTLQLAPERGIQVSFLASGDHITRRRHYAAAADLPGTGLRLYGNEWALLEAGLRLKDAGARYAFLPASRIWLERSVRRGLALHRGDRLGPGERVSGCSDWAQLGARLERQGLQRIIRLFERGFEERDLLALFAAAVDETGADLLLGLLDHAKNLESAVVAMAPCCFEDAAELRGFQPVHAAYLAMTRARHELWVPGDVGERLGAIAGS
ncbi:hypothetical protein [Xanthomonas sp. XNM01]|uniref:hypothetical protein n=1 Tax=Xanthomonas sp. XNM01 TaxID=2769289 RepID=UPI00177C0C18|nr:hypothetical protein [Xanthomonas sp. XNM01]MBD9368503.1 hypothetical protein [Xanthomonas sp. XNM01]